MPQLSDFLQNEKCEKWGQTRIIRPGEYSRAVGSLISGKSKRSVRKPQGLPWELLEGERVEPINDLKHPYCRMASKPLGHGK